MKTIAVRKIERADPGEIDRLQKFGVATVHEALGRSGLLQPSIRPVVPGARVAGSAVTALCAPGDNLMLHVGIELVQPGDILVVATMSGSTDGYVGDLLATSLAARGAKGLVIDAGARDVAEIRTIGFPVWSRAVSAQGTVKETVGAANVPVVCAGVQVVPGDVVVADDDGVVVVPRLRAGAAIAEAAAREAKEADLGKRLAAGELTLDALSLRGKLTAGGLTYLDGPIDWRGDDPMRQE
jgi:4-hydroxy-4-methyl-2-oxoglutarate aldolase